MAVTACFCPSDSVGKKFPEGIAREDGVVDFITVLPCHGKYRRRLLVIGKDYINSLKGDTATVKCWLRDEPFFCWSCLLDESVVGCDPDIISISCVFLERYLGRCEIFTLGLDPFIRRNKGNWKDLAWLSADGCSFVLLTGDSVLSEPDDGEVDDFLPILIVVQVVEKSQPTKL